MTAVIFRIRLPVRAPVVAPQHCDVDGVVRQYRKNGETKTKARANLKAFFVEHQTGLKIGMVMMAFAGPFYLTWSVAISRVITRIEGRMGGLAQIQLLGGMLTGLVTFIPALSLWLPSLMK